jgi:hypothetical protein
VGGVPLFPNTLEGQYEAPGSRRTRHRPQPVRPRARDQGSARASPGVAVPAICDRLGGCGVSAVAGLGDGHRQDERADRRASCECEGADGKADGMPPLTDPSPRLGIRATR